MRSFTSADAKNNFGELIDVARAGPVAITKYERPVVVVLAVEEFERLKALDPPASPPPKRKVRLPPKRKVRLK
jgi:prevent-host-death family protein